ncbi:Aspartic peptidase [Artemisia annua]|uniref:Aspartic peptidase n=1 Tax=Artemisia annua TaxID=35608 RepID=A0A2U1KV72_ARTAN|nr:Aspartic peptidase [Artemisia annua]
MFHLIQLIVMVLAFISHEHEAVATLWEPPLDSYPPLIAPVTKRTGAAKDLYTVEIMTDWVSGQYVPSDFLIDIDAHLAWHACIVQPPISTYKCPIDTLCNTYIPCSDIICSDIRTFYSYESPSCIPVNNNTVLPGAGCTCPINVANPVTGGCLQVEISYDDFTGVSLVAGCAPSSALVSLPKNVTGVMAFSRSPYAYPAQLTNPRKNILALYFPSTTSARGLLLFGESPLYLPPHSDVDVTSSLSYTPLLAHPNSLGYFIGVNAIVIKNRSTDLPINTTTKLSTTDPYTTLRTDIYNRVAQRFSKVTKRIPRVAPVPPFSLCFKSFTNGTQVGLKVPGINLILQGGKNWTISTENSIKQIGKEVACLAFVDGGAKREPAIVIGTFQFQDYFIVFDVENSRFGFSSSLLHKRTSG